MNYGQSQAVMVLAGERMGFRLSNAANARSVLEGKPVHVMFGAAIEKEATELHNKIRKDADLVAKANQHCIQLIAEYHLTDKPQRSPSPGMRPIARYEKEVRNV